MKGFSTAIPGKVVENKFELGTARREAVQDWDLRTVDTVLEQWAGSPGVHGARCCCAGDCPSSVPATEARLQLTQEVTEDSRQPGDLVIEYSLQPMDPDTLVQRVFGEGLVASATLRRQKDTRRISVA